MKFSVVFLLPLLSLSSEAFTQPSSSSRAKSTTNGPAPSVRDIERESPIPLSLFKLGKTAEEATPTNGLTTKDDTNNMPSTSSVLSLFKFGQAEELTTLADGTAPITVGGESSEGEWIDESKKIELILLSVWMVSISSFILINNFVGPWPEVMRTVPERVFFLNHMIGGMLFGGGIILTTCIERLVSKSNNAPVLQFWFDKVPLLDGLIVVPALTVSMISGTGLAIVRYGGLNIAPPHVGAIFWTLIAFLTWWAVTDLTTQGTSLAAANEMYSKYEDGESDIVTPQVIVDRHVSNVVSCFFVVLLYSFMVLKPGTLFPFPWA